MKPMPDAVPLFLLLTALAWVALGAVTFKPPRKAEPRTTDTTHPTDPAHAYAAQVVANTGITGRAFKRKMIRVPDGGGGWREVDVTTTEDIRPEPRPTFHRLAWADVHPTMDRLVKEPLRHPDDPALISCKCEATGEGFDRKTGEYESGLLTIWYRPVTPKDTERPRDGRFRR
jgi:hypothetical protein